MTGERALRPDGEYSAACIDHFTQPRNVGAVEAPDGKGSDANPSCGDRTTITLRVREGGVVEARFRTFGCTAAIAAASALTELASGRTLEEAQRLEPADVLRALGGLPTGKEACALMAVGALRAALLDARVRSAGEQGDVDAERHRRGRALPDRAAGPTRAEPAKPRSERGSTV